MTRVAVFVDYQNAYMRARRAFGDERSAYTVGQFWPGRLGALVRDRGLPVDPRRRLAGVWAYRGEPEPRRDPTGHAACRLQSLRWRDEEGVHVVTRPLHYLVANRGAKGPVSWVAREKGIDVRLAIDMVMGAARDEYDVAVLVSVDADLVPALEAVLALGKRVETAVWSSRQGYEPRLSVPGRRLWCHRLGRSDFAGVRDDTDYARPGPAQGGGRESADGGV